MTALEIKVRVLVAVYRDSGKEAAQDAFARMVKGAKHYEVVALREQFHKALTEASNA